MRDACPVLATVPLHIKERQQWLASYLYQMQFARLKGCNDLFHVERAYMNWLVAGRKAQRHAIFWPKFNTKCTLGMFNASIGSAQIDIHFWLPPKSLQCTVEREVGGMHWDKLQRSCVVRLCGRSRPCERRHKVHNCACHYNQADTHGTGIVWFTALSLLENQRCWCNFFVNQMC